MTAPLEEPAAARRVEVRKTYKLFVGGAFPRSESGRSYVVQDTAGRFLANASAASRKDARNAVQAARKAFAGWSSRTPYNRGQVLYRVAEVLEGRRAQFIDEVQRSEGVGRRQARALVNLTVDRLVWYAGWADKIAQVVGGTNPVAGPYLNFSVPEPTGVVAVLAPSGSSLLGLVSVVAPVIVTGNTVVVASSHQRPLPAITFSEVLATSDVPGGVVNVLTGPLGDTAPTLASHLDVNALDLTGLAGDAERATELEQSAADNLKRVLRAPLRETDWARAPGLERMTAFLETKTVWHPIGV
jgi:acyl-CoA reductase-like NAD-dependent aldehyde dehydrogenase